MTATATTPDLAIVVSPRGWAEDLHRFVADHGGARVRARVLDAREALDQTYDVLVAEDLTSFLTPRLVNEVHRRGRRVLGVYDPVEPQGAARLEELGVDSVLPSTAGPDELVAEIGALTFARRLDLGVAIGDAADPGDVDGPPDVPATPRGRFVAVGGPAGGPGVTETTLGLAAAASRDRTVAVVDGDVVAPAIAQRLGAPPHPNLRTAIDVVENLTGRVEETLHTAAPRLAALPGIAARADWAQVRAGEALDVVEELRRRHELVLADVGHDLEELAVGLRARYETPRALVAAADEVVVVAGLDPLGLTRALDWIADVRALTRAPVSVVVNRAPGSAYKRTEFETELRRTFSPPTLAFAPRDRRVEEAAWAGRLVTGGRFARTMHAVVERLGDLQPAHTAGSQATAPDGRVAAPA